MAAGCAPLVYNDSLLMTMLFLQSLEVTLYSTAVLLYIGSMFNNIL